MTNFFGKGYEWKGKDYTDIFTPSALCDSTDSQLFVLRSLTSSFFRDGGMAPWRSSGYAAAIANSHAGSSYTTSAADRSLTFELSTETRGR